MKVVLLLLAAGHLRCYRGGNAKLVSHRPVVAMQMLAKLVSGIHKPDDQTVLLPIAATEFMTQLPLRAIPGDLSTSPLHCLHQFCAISAVCH